MRSVTVNCIERSLSWEADAAQVVKKFPDFVAESVITVFTQSRSQTVSWAGWIQSIPINFNIVACYGFRSNVTSVPSYVTMH
jgi:hypothetical protein